MTRDTVDRAPLVSCIIPVHNGEPYLAAAIESVLGQTYRPIEAIVVDDGSTDGSAEVAARYGAAVRLIRQPNRGVAAARNAGIVAAAGRFLSFLDADDLWPADRTTQLMRVLEREPGVDFCCGCSENFWEDSVATERDRLGAWKLAGRVFAILPTASLYRREMFERAGPFDEHKRPWDDKVWHMRAEALGLKSCATDAVVLRRRIHRDNSSRSKNAATRAEILDAVQRHLQLRRTRRGAEDNTARAAERREEG